MKNTTICRPFFLCGARSRRSWRHDRNYYSPRSIRAKVSRPAARPSSSPQLLAARAAPAAPPAPPAATVAAPATTRTAASKGGNGGNGGASTTTPPTAGSAPRPAVQWPTAFNPWAGTIQLTGPGLLGPAPSLPPRAPFAGSAVHGPPSFQGQAHQAGFLPPAPLQLPGPAHYATPPSVLPPSPMAVPQPPLQWITGPSQWDPQALAASHNTATLATPNSNEWYMDSGASSHMTSNTGTLCLYNPSPTSPSHIVVGDGSRIPITSIGSTYLHHPNHSFVLNDVHVSPHIIKDLILARRFARDNSCSVCLDPFGFSVKDYQTRIEIARCNSSGDLYPFSAESLPSTALAHTFVASTSSTELWHRRLRHLSHDALLRLAQATVIPPPKGVSTLCHACQLGRHTHLPFVNNFTRATAKFELIHCDLWTSPIPSVSGFKYYLVILDDFSHYVWTFPLRFKSDTFTTLSHFFAFVETQFSCSIRGIQCDNGREFDNASTRQFFLLNGVSLRMSCPHTSPQNGKAESMLRSLNNIVRSLLFQASLPSSFWVEALHTATHLINRHPTKTLQHHTPYFALYGAHPSYTHLRVFGCNCYPNISATTPHKLAPRSVMCVFLGYPPNHKGYRCFDPVSNRVIISRHVVFDEHVFPFAELTKDADATSLDFLDDFSVTAPTPIGRRTGGPRTGARCHTPPTAGLPPTGPPPTLAWSDGPSTTAPTSVGPSASPRPRPTTTSPPASRSPAPSSLPRHASPLRSLGATSPTSASPAPGATGVTRPSPGTSWLAPPPTGAITRPRSARVPGVRPPPAQLGVSPVFNNHAMVTRGKVGVHRPATCFNLHAAPLSPIPSTYRAALANPHWRAAMED